MIKVLLMIKVHAYSVIHKTIVLHYDTALPVIMLTLECECREYIMANGSTHAARYLKFA